MPERRSTASCLERLDGSMSISASRSRTGRGPSWSSSRTRMRTGWPSIRKNSALAWYSGTGIRPPPGAHYASAQYTELKTSSSRRGMLMADGEAALDRAGLTNPQVRQYVSHWAELTGATRVEVVSAADDERLIGAALAAGEIWPAGERRYYARSHVRDTARSEERTFVATSDPA